MPNIADLVVPYSGNNPLFGNILDGHQRVIKFKVGELTHDEESTAIATSASVFYDLGIFVLQPLISRMGDAESLGYLDHEIEEQRPEIFEAVRQFAIATLELWYNALKSKDGVDSPYILDAITRLKKKEVTSTFGMVELVNRFADPIQNRLDIATLKPRNGWVQFDQDLKWVEGEGRGPGYGHYL